MVRATFINRGTETDGVPDLGLVLLQHPAGLHAPRVPGEVEHHHALLVPPDERAVRDALHHVKEVFVAVVACGHHREGRPVVLLQHLKNDLQLQGSGGCELQVDGATLLKGGGEEEEEEERGEEGREGFSDGLC